MKSRKCKICSIIFDKKYPLQFVCSPKCAAEYGKRSLEKKNKSTWSEEKKIIKDKITSKAEWLNIAQKVFNTYIRTRDKGKPCISCGTTKQDIQYHAGHFYSIGSHSNLRFDEDNVHLQCGNYCNKNLHGNLILYAENLPLRIGVARFKDLQSRRGQQINYTIDEVKILIQLYKLKTKNLLKQYGD